MPTYEYRCAEGHEFEAFQKMSDEPLTECPECGAAAERKISSGAGLVFKGSGFYITDYKKAGEKKGTAAEGKSEGASADSGSGSSGDGSGSGTSGSSGKSGGPAGEGKKSSAD
ncbi:MAG: FmdB family zinc ribbon protein [Gemmatimonadota bacterium]